MDKVSTDNTKKEDSLISLFPVIFRYIVLCILYGYIFFFIYSDSAQYLLFIGLFFMNLFTMIFLARDFMGVENIYKNMFNPQSLSSDKVNAFITLFVIAIFATLFIQFLSIIMVLIVFNYGNQGTNNNNTYVLTTPNNLIMNKYKILITITTLLTFMFAVIVALFNLDSISKGFLLTIVGCTISAIMIIMAGYGLFIAYGFMDVKSKKRALYK